MIDLRTTVAVWRRSPVVVRDLPLAALLAVAPWVDALQGQGTRLGDVPQRPLDALALVPVAMQALPLAVRRRWPAVSLALVGVGFAVDQLAGYSSVASVALPIALVSAGAHLAHHRRAVVVVASAGYVALAVALDRTGTGEQTSGFVVFYVLLAAAWGVGVWLRQTRAAEAERRRHVAETTRLTERTRIARDLHDVVTHHVTAMVVQAEAARYLTVHPDRLDAALTAVTDTGRRAISDLRQVLDLLDPAEATPERTPAGGGLGELVERTRAAGQPVDYVAEGEPRATPGNAEAAAYRVVQEGLTNALKHARGQRTAVHVRHGREVIAVEVATYADAPGRSRPPSSATAAGSGRGLAGLRERVVALGGELTAGPDDGAAFVVRARIPLGGAS
ncbi:two-component sensor histidine kinase [Actinotalea ferrariae]|uniref:sensor histidine kinase n=1 Tax=Actinotalea ferrariae TaxID=1386098 RepID=UPI001C8BE212|nr:histidine kinase [Actinotalea ferrariae]MBX9245819.1 two-component sensor histidine kinase [Actinotalea ferrariae]